MAILISRGVKKTMGTWWRVGLLMCVVDLLILAVIGSVWWKVLGFW
ncbi:2-oxoglutarate/malate translocator (plasmid) [Cupriavidus necator H850]|nr:anion permease [Cupriavidus necator]KAI3611230.1 2-oxoglutarate/malate translocator [Cupriavidus necator H850]